MISDMLSPTLCMIAVGWTLIALCLARMWLDQVRPSLHSIEGMESPVILIERILIGLDEVILPRRHWMDMEHYELSDLTGVIWCARIGETSATYVCAAPTLRHLILLIHHFNSSDDAVRAKYLYHFEENSHECLHRHGPKNDTKRPPDGRDYPPPY